MVGGGELVWTPELRKLEAGSLGGILVPLRYLVMLIVEK
jgi:hypothetical protein